MNWDKLQCVLFCWGDKKRPTYMQVEHFNGYKVVPAWECMVCGRRWPRDAILREQK